MSYKVVLTIARPNSETEFDSPNAAHELPPAVKVDRAAANGFVSEKRRMQGDVLTVTHPEPGLR